ncbi:hypothetical protein [Pseudomonas sp. MUP55]|uniref:hypothetical protein n=1 Tax=Pseudomonas sp. MUP55 TaxID=3087234 RepID=UPI002A5AB953|nr:MULTISPECIES: hypothetical protein [unclassified Pseudomonas]WPN90354.1 hypothetical protein SC319_13855 [Pseudomonas sp. MUP56]WPN95879.1 hypothetical protein SC318_13860 [Pseudomonas sp. MUP55]
MSKHLLLGWPRSLCVLAVLSGAATMAGAAPPEKNATVAPDTQSVSLAGGKLTFVLKGVEARTLNSESGGTMYFDPESERAIIVTEGPASTAGTTPDAAFGRAIDTLKEKQQAASPNFRMTGENTLEVNGLKMYRLDGTDDFNGLKLLMASLMTMNDQQITIIEVMSSVNDPASHTAALKNILGQ